MGCGGSSMLSIKVAPARSKRSLRTGIDVFSNTTVCIGVIGIIPGAPGIGRGS